MPTTVSILVSNTISRRLLPTSPSSIALSADSYPSCANALHSAAFRRLRPLLRSAAFYRYTLVACSLALPPTYTPLTLRRLPPTSTSSIALPPTYTPLALRRPLPTCSSSLLLSAFADLYLYVIFLTYVLLEVSS
jgi:hypothetical protein